eukprot:COSAG01_NODE_23157_length_826_cov_0.991747_1_plen_111_part_00
MRRVVAGLASKQAPQLTAGCKLLSVNGTSVASLSFEDASLQVFAKAGRPITMVWELPTAANTQGVCVGGRGGGGSTVLCTPVVVRSSRSRFDWEFAFDVTHSSVLTGHDK